MALRIFVSVLLISAAAFATPCPDKIQFKGGNYLKKGNDLYFSSGQHVFYNGRIYYPNGTYLMKDGNTYYSTGQYLQKGANLYFPTGQYLKKDSNYYYENGQYLKKDSTFYYSNGTYARHNGKMYRPDGSLTPFPVTLRQTIGTFGELVAEVEPTKETVDVYFRDLVTKESLVSVRAFWDGAAFSSYEIYLTTGVPHENVFVTIKGGTMTCELDGGAVPPPTPGVFTVAGRAGVATVTVAPGYNAQTVREAILRALDF